MSTLEDLAKQAKAAKELIDNVSAILGDAARSAVIEVTNATTQTLTIHGTKQMSGGFAENALPANTIPPMQSNVFGARSAEGGIFVGTEGGVWYTIGADTAVLYVRWNVPWSGDNEYSVTLTGASPGFYRAVGLNSAGTKKVKFRFTLAEEALMGPSDADWITCNECKGLFYKLHTGKCPGRPKWDGVGPRPGPTGHIVNAPTYLGHQTSGHGLKLFHSVPGPNREGGWRRCRRCEQLFFDGFEDGNKGACPKWDKPRPGHVAAPDSPEFFLPFDVAPHTDQQNDWRFCTKCNVLFFLPHNVDGDCAAGGKHRAHAFNYVLNKLG